MARSEKTSQVDTGKARGRENRSERASVSSRESSPDGDNATRNNNNYVDNMREGILKRHLEKNENQRQEKRARLGEIRGERMEARKEFSTHFKGAISELRARIRLSIESKEKKATAAWKALDAKATQAANESVEKMMLAGRKLKGGYETLARGVKKVAHDMDVFGRLSESERKLSAANEQLRAMSEQLDRLERQGTDFFGRDDGFFEDNRSETGSFMAEGSSPFRVALRDITNDVPNNRGNPIITDRPVERYKSVKGDTNNMDDDRHSIDTVINIQNSENGGKLDS